METSHLKARFMANVTEPVAEDDIASLAEMLAAAGRKPSREDRIDMAAALAQAAFLAPERIAITYDAFTAGWRGRPIAAKPIPATDAAPGAPPKGLWDAWFAVIEDAIAGNLDALTITARTAALGEFLDQTYADRMVTAAHLYPGVTEAAARPLPDLFTLDQLGANPKGSLARTFHDLIVDNKFDLEVLDRGELGLAALPKPLDYLNTEILRAHDLWHIMAGYETTALHEIAISAFQMAQFGHAYSAHFLSMTAGIAAVSPGLGYPILMDTITSAWAHGRETPPLIGIEWEKVWDKSVNVLRADYGITPYERPYAANLIEKSRSPLAALTKVKVFFASLAAPFRRTKAA